MRGCSGSAWLDGPCSLAAIAAAISDDDLPALPEHIGAPAAELINAMLCKDPGRRIALIDVAAHAWVTRGGAEPLELDPGAPRGGGAPLTASAREVCEAVVCRRRSLDEIDMLASGARGAATAIATMRKYRSEAWSVACRCHNAAAISSAQPAECSYAS